MKNNFVTSLVKNGPISLLSYKKKPLTLLFILCLTSLSISAQTVPKGKVNLIEFNSNSSVFKVPEGKTWYVYNIFCDRKSDQGAEDEIVIIMKSVNDVVFKRGPIVFLSERAINFPMIFPEKTTFELDIKSHSDISDIKAIMTYIETDN
jgi:hypothetical protein